MATIEVAPRAAADVDHVLIDLHGRGGRAAAVRRQSQFAAATRLLSRHPELGRRRPDVGPELRSVLVDPYILIYTYDRAADTVFVLRVLHGRRRLSLDAP